MDRGARLGRTTVTRLGQEIRDERLNRSLSVDVVARAAGISNAEVSRIERGLAPRVAIITMARLAGVVGLDLAVRFYPGAAPLRDAAHAELLADFRARLHGSIRWMTEVPLPIPGDQRAWDATVSGAGWRYGVEAETSPRDAQALNRRLSLKHRDGGLDGVLLLVRGTRTVRRFLHEAMDELAPSFPVRGARALELLREGVDPGGSAAIIIPRRPRPRDEVPARAPTNRSRRHTPGV